MFSIWLSNHSAKIATVAACPHSDGGGMLTKSEENRSVEFDSAFKNINKKESSIQTDYCIVNVLNGGNKFGFIHAENKRIFL